MVLLEEDGEHYINCMFSKLDPPANKSLQTAKGQVWWIHVYVYTPKSAFNVLTLWI